MKTNELSNELKKVYAKPAIEVEEMEVQWEFLSGLTPSGLSKFTYSSSDVSDWVNFWIWTGEGPESEDYEDPGWYNPSAHGYSADDLGCGK